MIKTAGRRYFREFGFAMAAYVVVLIVAITLVNLSPHSAWWRIPLILTPVIPAIFGIISFMRFMSRMDELQRRIQFEAIAFGFASTAILTFSYGFLELIGFPHINWFIVFPLMTTLWGIGGVIASRKYQ